MKKKNGFTLIELLGVIILLGVISLIAVSSVTKFLDSSKLTTFVAYESSMKTAAKNAIINCIEHYSNKCDVPEKNETNRIKLSYLIEEGFLDEIKTSNDDKCDIERSFISVKNKGNGYDIDVCLYCDNYKTNSNICN